MSQQEKIFILAYAFVNIFLALKGFYESKYKRNSYGLTRALTLFGMFVWGDAMIFGIFWAFVSFISLYLNNWYLFLLMISVFWVVRSLGETIYWFNQQFSQIKRDPPESLWGYFLVKNDSIWFIYQIVWQCIAVLFIVYTIYLSKLWLQSW